MYTSLVNAELCMGIAALVTRFNFEFLETDVGDIKMAIDAQHHPPTARVQSESLQRDRPINVSDGSKVRNELDEKAMESGRNREDQERKLKIVTTARSDHWSCLDRFSPFPKRDGLIEIMVTLL